MSNLETAATTAAVITITAMAYFLPAVIALYRSHRNAAPIVLLNLFTGWTGLGWIAALIWSVSDNTRQEAQP